jgi:hypothetical protein
MARTSLTLSARYASESNESSRYGKVFHRSELSDLANSVWTLNWDGGGGMLEVVSQYLLWTFRK